MAGTVSSATAVGGTAGTNSGGFFNVAGSAGDNSMAVITAAPHVKSGGGVAAPGLGSASPLYLFGSTPQSTNGPNRAANTAGGGIGGLTIGGGGAAAGGNGGSGRCLITEFVSP
jgi:hypothetical protein